jgi:oligoribonuclease
MTITDTAMPATGNATVAPASNLWLDFETTSLDERTGDIVDVGVIATDFDFNILTEYATAFQVDADALAAIASTPVVHEMMQANGLLEEVIAGSIRGDLPTLVEVERKIVAIIDEFTDPNTKVKVTLSGSGVATFDLRWIKAQMPTLADRLTYFTHDVGVLRREWKNATGGDLVAVNDAKPHRGIDDIRLHLEEGRAFRQLFTRVAQAAGGGDLATILAWLDRVAAH